jgi:hypothetical protein
MSSVPSADIGDSDFCAGGTLLSGREKRTAFKNRWLTGRKSMPGQDEVSAAEATSAPTGRAPAKNRWLKGLLTSAAIRRSSSKCTEEVVQTTTLDVNPNEVCMISESPYYVLTVSGGLVWTIICSPIQDFCS